MRFTPDGSQLVAATNVGGNLLVFDAGEWKKSADWKIGATDSILSLALSKDGTKIAIGRANGGISLWDWKSQRKILDYVGHIPNGKTNAALVWGLAFSPDSRLLASAGYDDQRHSLYLWPTSETEPIAVAWEASD